jgi:hypothetical protein
VAHLRSFLAILALLFAAVAISAPAAARERHELNHASSPVASGEHHHHDEDGSVTSHSSDSDAAPQSDDTTAGNFGHSHMVNMAFDALPFGSTGLAATMIVPAEVPAGANTPVLRTLGWSPQKRPPRTA